ncbi:cytochrome P450 [Cyathus striatus]|nr:cytochrome P450 [Cyathus striatus]
MVPSFRIFQLRHIPTIRYSTPILSYISTINFIFNGMDMILEGYQKASMQEDFKVPFLRRWMVIMSGEELLGELKTAPDSIFSAALASDEFLQIQYNMGSEITTNLNTTYHVPIIRTHFGTQNLHNQFPDMRDEMLTAFSEIFSVETGWAKYSATDVFPRIIVRVADRVVIGLPICRNEEYLDNAIKFATDVTNMSSLINILPSFLWPYVSRALSTYVLRGPSNRINFTLAFLMPVISRCRKELADTNEHESTYLKLLISEAKGEEQANIRLVRRVIWRSTSGLYHCPYNLNNYLDIYTYIVLPFCKSGEEVERVVSQDGWSKASLDEFIKLDSFIRETQRLYPFSSFGFMRKVLKDYTFKNGTFIQKNTIVAVALDGVSTDSEIYPNADEFDGFRFVKMNEIDRSTDNKFMPFGAGRHRCPGRFFATTTMKLLLSHIIVNYDVRFEEGVRPKDILLGPSRQPNPKAEIMFRRRESSL